MSFRKQQKIKRYDYSSVRTVRKRRESTPFRTAAVVACSVLLIALFAFAIRFGMKYWNEKIPGWHGEKEGRVFLSSDGLQRLTGLYQIEDSLYYFDADGILQTGWIDQNGCRAYANLKGQLLVGENEIDGVSYYFQPDNGQLYTGWQNIDGTPYCFDSTGHPRSGLYEENGVMWYLNEDGSAAEGYFTASNGETYYFSKEGRATNSFVTIGDKRYYFDENGQKVTGWYETADGWYCFDENGVQQTGEQAKDGATYYYDPSTGKLAKGWQIVDGQTLYFNEDGSRGEGFEEIDGLYYYFVAGVSQAGKIEDNRVPGQTKTYYLDGSGHYRTGWSVIDELPYAFDENGVAKSGTVRTGTDVYQGLYYKIYVFQDGVSQAGTVQDGLSSYELNGCGDPIVSEEQTTEAETQTEPVEITAESGTAAETQTQQVQTTAFLTTLTLNGQSIALGQSLSDSSYFPGTPASTDGDEAPGSATFHYDSFDLYGSETKLSRIDLLSAAVATPEGAAVGMSEAQIAGIYGTGYQVENSVMIYQNSSGVTLRFVLDGAGNVTSISYRM